MSKCDELNLTATNRSNNGSIVRPEFFTVIQSLYTDLLVINAAILPFSSLPFSPFYFACFSILGVPRAHTTSRRWAKIDADTGSSRADELAIKLRTVVRS